MAPSINDLPAEQYAPVGVKSSKLRVLRPENESHDDRGAVGYDGSNTTLSAANAEDMPLFTMPSMQKLQQAQWRVQHDFRSDTVTVPTVNMMQVCENCPSLECLRGNTLSILNQYINRLLTSESRR